MKTNKTLLSAAVAFGLFSTSGVVNAAGFQLAEYSATGLGRAYAGEAAMADNAGAQWRNPAMLSYLEGTQVSVGGIYVNPNIDVEGTTTYIDGSHNAVSKDFAHDAVIPNFYLSHQYNEKLAVGVAFGTNYGMETDLGKDFAAANFGNKASVFSVEANLNAAYQINQQVSIGGGIRYIMADGSIGASVPNHVQAAPAMNLKPQTTLKYMEGDDTAWGWQIGTAWQINPNHRLGFAYKSAVDLTLEGDASGWAFNPANPTAKKAGSMDLTLPATAELASFHQLSDQLALHASVNWTDWSSFKELVADFPDKSDLIKSENWKDNYRFAVGTTYQVDSKLALRTGVAYDLSAVNDKYRTTTIPETDRLWLSVGAGYQWSKQLTLDAGLTYIIAKDAPISEPRDASDNSAALFGGAFEGEVTGDVWLVGVQANYTF